MRALESTRAADSWAFHQSQPWICATQNAAIATSAARRMARVPFTPPPHARTACTCGCHGPLPSRLTAHRTQSQDRWRLSSKNWVCQPNIGGFAIEAFGKARLLARADQSDPPGIPDGSPSDRIGSLRSQPHPTNHSIGFGQVRTLCPRCAALAPASRRIRSISAVAVTPFSMGHVCSPPWTRNFWRGRTAAHAR